MDSAYDRHWKHNSKVCSQILHVQTDAHSNLNRSTCIHRHQTPSYRSILPTYLYLLFLLLFFYITRCTILTLSIAHIAWFTHNDQQESLNELNDIERRLLCDSTGHDISDHVSLLDSEQWMERNYVIMFWRLIYRLLWFGNWLYK